MCDCAGHRNPRLQKYDEFTKQSKIGCNVSVTFGKGDMYEFREFIADLCMIAIAMLGCEAQRRYWAVRHGDHVEQPSHGPVRPCHGRRLCDYPSRTYDDDAKG
ncbi:hypothetical protein FOL46_005343 [Perkinsus olseni]|uniref:Uncharacterized protein n=1 Tax=Perkinsus olseni TaxID=32597 RepID=A0A7J6LSU4_PEROL|nr:hypothetical protein FOL46_005343 [Perkinsus olseni]